MQGQEMAMEVDDPHRKNNPPSTPTRARTKKKSTLAKLKEKKQRELGSNSSLGKVDTRETSSQKYEEPDAYNDYTKKDGSLPLTSDSHSVRHFSTKDQMVGYLASEKSRDGKNGKPRPMPRGVKPTLDADSSSVQFGNGDNSIETETIEEKRLKRKDRKYSTSSISDGATLQRFQNLKMVGDQSDSIESTISQGGFIPKPPVTPRTPRSTPRTPRNYIPPGKGEKRNREPGLSGDEPEVEEKKERNTDVPDIDTNCDLDGGLKTRLVHTSDGAVNPSDRFVDGKIKDSRRLPGQATQGQRLLKRRNSKDTGGGGSGSSDLSRDETNYHTSVSDLGKPPVNRSVNNSNNNNNDSSSSHQNYTSEKNANISTPRTEDLTMYRSPRDKYLKSRSRSKSLTSHSQRGDGTISGIDLKHVINTGDSDPSRLHSARSAGLPSSHPVHSFSETSSTGRENLLLTDIEGKNKSTQVIFTSQSPHVVRSISTPPNTARLEPLSPRSQPPPMTEDFASQSLRVAYKIDPNVRPGTGSARVLMGDKSDSGTPSTADRLSQKSSASGGVLPVITTKEARSRSYLEGSVSEGSMSQLGFEELDRYFPERKVHVLAGTWNMNELKEVTSSLDDFILPEKCDYIQDIYAIGTQENAMNKKEWEIKLQETLGPSHVMFHSVTLGSLHLVVYIRRDLIWFCSTPEDDVISLRAMTMVKTKGAIGICFTLFGTSYLFINCHLTSDRDNDNTRKKSRLGDYFKVIQDMKLPKSSNCAVSSKKSGDVTAIFDCVFWFGDLNFRIERKRHAVEGMVHQITAEEFPNFETLLGGDQLHKYMTDGKIFAGFQEGRINFHPTFKFDVNKDTYDSSSKNRVPSYTDRVMFRCKKKNEIVCLHYDAVMAIKMSDHRPVYGQYETGVRPGRENMVYSAGHFDRSVYLEANKRRAVSQPVRKKVSSVCSVQ